MKIVFVLPAPSLRPVGGFKIVYEYANRLADRGHGVSVVHPMALPAPTWPWTRLWARARAEHYRRNVSIAPWFSFDSRVELMIEPSLDLLPELPADALVATAWQTAACVAAASSPPTRGFQLVQGHETWQHPEEVEAAWRLPLQKIAISRWLEEVAIELGEGSRTSRVANAIDFDEFGIDVPPAERPLRVGAIAGRAKGGKDLVAALSLARAELPELQAVVFGSGVRPRDLPDWVEYERLPDSEALRRLYNSCAIFVQAGRSEGWGLPATESMACGCALVTYDNGGSREYAFDGRTAVVAARHDPQELADGIVRLACDRRLRLAVAGEGRSLVERFTWDKAVVALERVLQGTPQHVDARK